MEKTREMDQLGLPPMELAEPSNERRSRCLYRCMYPALQKVLIMLSLVTLSAGVYILLLKLLESIDNSRTTEIIVVTGLQNTPNITFHQNDVDVVFKMRNFSDVIHRNKRSVQNYPHESVFDHLNKEDFETVKKIITQHNILCNEQNHHEACAELVGKFNAIINKHEDVSSKSQFNVARDKNSLSNEKVDSSARPRVVRAQNLTDTCLLAKLLRQSFPHAQEIYNPPPENVAPIFDHRSRNMRYFPATPLPFFMQNREIENRQKQHPQDFNILLNFFQSVPKPDTTKSSRLDCPPASFACDNNEECVEEKLRCDGSVDCADASDEIRCSCKSRVDKARLCDGYFDCPFGEDEMGCFGCSEDKFSCETDPSRSESTCFSSSQRCDGAFDCANHRDELECNMLAPILHKKPLFAISNTEGYLHRNFRGQWHAVCHNPYMWAHDACRRETGLIIRPPIIQLVAIDPLQKVSYLSTGPGGFVQTSDSCFNSSAVYVTCPDFLCGTRVHTTSQMLNEDIAVENQLFGRNKRFLLPGYPYHPYHQLFFGNRRKRDLESKTAKSSVYSYDDIHKVSFENKLKGDVDAPTDTLEADNNHKANYETKHIRDIDSKTAKYVVPHDRDAKLHFSKRLKRNKDAKSIDKLHFENKRDVTFKAQSGVRTLDDRNKRSEARVVGGRPSQPAAWPWVGAVYRDGVFHCGGVILTQSWVVSAAHCMHKFWEHYYEVQVGMLRRLSFSPQEHNHRVTHVIVNHHYNQEDMRGDLSLLRVEPDILFSRWVRPVCLPGPNTAGPNWEESPEPWTVCTAVGWGATVEHGPDPDHMREVEVPIWETCKHRQDREGKEICAGLTEGGKDACQGDSGGPLLCRNPLNTQQWYLAGIVSHGDGCARKGEPGVYTRVSLFVNWIRYHISSKSLPQVQPKQKCPGFVCRFGISKCLPDSRKCDKIVDCLDAQDEIDCDFKRSSNNIVTNKVNGTIINKSGINSREAETSTISSVSGTTLSNKMETTAVFVNKDNDNEESVTISPQFSTTDESTYFEHTSKYEPTESFEDTDNTLDINLTLGPQTVSTTEETTQSSESHSVSVTFEPKSLEFRSSVTQKVNLDENSEKRDSLFNNESGSMSTESNAPFTILPTTSLSKDTATAPTNIHRGDIIIPDEEIDIENDTTESESTIKVTTEISQDDINFNQETNSANILKITTRSESDTQTDSTPMVIELLPPNVLTTNAPQTNDKPNHNDQIAEQNKIITNNHDNTLGKNLADVEDKSDIHEIDNIVFSELQPANVRRKHLVPEEFQCRRIQQVIPHKQHCDQKADCEDGTDELDCTCTDYLSTFDENLICDGVFDCADGQDEIDCVSCPEDRFLCKQSKMCIPFKHVCDGKPLCPLGEDEHNCFALTNGRDLVYDIDDKPRISTEGFLTKRQNNEWEVVCEDQLTMEQQEQAANNVCRYLGFSSANNYLVKYINVKEEIRADLDELKRSKRGVDKTMPIHFAYRRSTENNTRNVIKDPQFLKEECVPNITRSCKSLYVFCDETLFTNFESRDLLGKAAHHETDLDVSFPWIAKVFVEGEYKCTGVLLNLHWVLVSDSCLWDTTPTQNLVTVVLGSHRTLQSTNGMFEQILKVDKKKDFYRSRVILLHLRKPAMLTNMVKPMKIPFSNFNAGNNTVCVAIGQDGNNETISIFVNETSNSCNLSNRCFELTWDIRVCPAGMASGREWAGLISCHGERGWFPAASFVDSRGECGVDRIVGTDIEALKFDIKKYIANENKSETSDDDDMDDTCEGVRCSRGRCVPLRQLCDGVRRCEDGADETDAACTVKRLLCAQDPHRAGCECTHGQLKCRTGECIPKQSFGDGKKDCADGGDEPPAVRCGDYIARSAPALLCDGVVNCQDRSDEDPAFCKCFAKHVFKCDMSGEDSCVAKDMVCDGTRDCPAGEDERVCLGLSARAPTPYGTGQVIVRSHGVWHSACYHSRNHTKTELEAICWQLGFLSGHAREITDERYLVEPYNHIDLEPFSDVVLNDHTTIQMRTAKTPVAKPVFAALENCYPVVIECL